jgi:major membrane immunogen (membrane-anchored lipoprotein)
MLHTPHHIPSLGSPPRASLPSLPSLLLTTLLLLSLLLSACSDDKPDPAAPEGVLRLFVQSISDNDKDAFWSYLDRDTRQLFRNYLNALFEVDAQITAHFANDPEEQLRLRALTGVGSTIKALSAEALKRPPKEQQITPKDLFLTVVNFSAVTIQEDHTVGAKPDTVEVAKDEQTATITTKSGQIYNMVYDPQAKAWRVARTSPAFLVTDPVSGTPKETTEILPDGSQRALLIVSCQSGLTYYMNKLDDVWQVEGISGAFLRTNDDQTQDVIIDIFAQAFVPLQNSVKALEQLTEERMSEERTRRERVIKLFDDAQARPAPGDHP